MTFDVQAASEEFAQDIRDMLDAVLPSAATSEPQARQIHVLTHETHCVVRPGTSAKPDTIPLLACGRPIADLRFHFHCYPDTAATFLAVRRSRFELTSRRQRMPLLRLDFDEKAHTVPASHWNVHGESGATSALLARSNVDHDGRLSKIHLPVGGVRYRPCLEDFIEMLICEFQFDTCDGWRHALYDGREQWRSFQTRAIVRDMPDAAADVLRRIGYGVAAPAIPPQRNRDMLRAR